MRGVEICYIVGEVLEERRLEVRSFRFVLLISSFFFRLGLGCRSRLVFVIMLVLGFLFINSRGFERVCVCVGFIY